MFGFLKKKKNVEMEEKKDAQNPAEKIRDLLYPIRFAAKYLFEKKEQLQLEEMETMERLSCIKDSFVAVTEKSNEINGSIESFRGEFGAIQEVTDKFEDIIKGMTKTADMTRKNVGQVVRSTKNVEETVLSIQDIFKEFQERFHDIQDTMEQITGIANQTNLLAINASIEAARAGEHGRGFVVVAEQVTRLSQEIKTLVSSVEKSMKSLHTTSEKMVCSITDTGNAIGESRLEVDKTKEVVESIKEVAAEISKESQNLITVFGKCDATIEGIAFNVSESVQYYDKVAQNIGDLENMITNKGFIFEDMTNIMEQIPNVADKIEEKLIVQ